jgi:WD40 repeat protein
MLNLINKGNHEILEDLLIQTIYAHDREINWIEYLPDGNMIITASQRDRSIKVWDLKKPENPIFTFTTDVGISDIALHPDGKHLAVCLFYGRIKIVDLEKEEIIRKIKIDRDWINNCSVAYSPNGKYFAYSSNPITIREYPNYGLYNKKSITITCESGDLGITTGDPREDLRCYEVSSLQFSPDSDYIAASFDCDNDKIAVRMWKIDEERESHFMRQNLSDYSINSLNSLCFSPKGKYLFGLSDTHDILGWEIPQNEGQRMRVNVLLMEDIFKDQNWIDLMECYEDPLATFVELQESECIFSTIDRDDMPFGRHFITPPRFSCENSRILSGSPVYFLIFIDPLRKTMIPLLKQKKEDLKFEDLIFSSCNTYSPDGRHIASGFVNGVLKIYNDPFTYYWTPDQVIKKIKKNEPLLSFDLIKERVGVYKSYLLMKIQEMENNESKKQFLDFIESEFQFSQRTVKPKSRKDYNTIFSILK